MTLNVLHANLINANKFRNYRDYKLKYTSNNTPRKSNPSSQQLTRVYTEKNLKDALPKLFSYLISYELTWNNVKEC